MLLKETSVAQWQALLTDAQAKSLINLEEEIESYLVFLLMRFTTRPEIANSVIGLEFLKSYQKVSLFNQQDMRDLADKCLLFSGLFPGRAKKRCVPLSYFVKVGKTSYLTLAEYDQNEVSELYFKLSEAFASMMNVLHASRITTNENINLDPFEAYNPNLAKEKIIKPNSSSTSLLPNNIPTTNKPKN